MDKKGIFSHLFEPGSIAVIGASNNERKPGGRVFANILAGGYDGELWPVNPKASEIMGKAAYSDIAALPGAPELALIAIPAGGVLDAVQALGKKGNKAVIILTAGFGETGETGKKMEQDILGAAGAYGMSVIGPNCSGFLTPVYAGKFAGIIPELEPGCVDFISGSGATVDYFLEQAQTRGIRFSHVVNLGNSIQLGVEDMLGLLDDTHSPESAKIILLYLEAVNRPMKLLHHARSLIQKGCTLMGIKSGSSGTGARAAASHTGAMATADHTVQALFDKAGIIRVGSKMELLEATCALISMGRLPAGSRACIVTDAGGPGVMLSDELERQGLTLPFFSDNTLAALEQVLPPQAALENPVDCLPSRSAEQIQSIFNILGDHEAANLDVAFFITGNSGLSDNGAIYDAVKAARETCPIPIIPVLSSATTCAHLLKGWSESGQVYFHDEVVAGRAVGHLVNRPLPLFQDASLANYDKDAIGQYLSGKTGPIAPETTEQILRAAGFSFPEQQTVYRQEQLGDACRAVGFPLAMKVVGPLHKSDVGGVKVDIQDRTRATEAWQELTAIPGAEGVMLQKMVSGPEVIIGTVREGDFGQLIMFGLGGIYTEVLKDVSFSLSSPKMPLSVREAKEMIRGIRACAILEGVRGGPGMCMDTLADYLVRTARLVTDFPVIGELDFNPVKGEGDRLYVVDARIVTG